MLGSNQRPLPCEGSAIVCQSVLELAKLLQTASFFANTLLLFSGDLLGLLHRCYGLHPYKVREDRYSPSRLAVSNASFVLGNSCEGRCRPQRAKRVRARFTYPTARKAQVSVKMRRL